MFSRRSLRVKALQILYHGKLDDALTNRDLLNLLKDNIQRVYQVYIYQLWFIKSVIEYTYTDAIVQTSKLLQPAESSEVNNKLAETALYEFLATDNIITKQVKQFKLSDWIDDEVIKQVFFNLKKSEEYNAYLNEKEQATIGDKFVVKHLYKHFMLKDPLFDEHMVDLFAHWHEDRDFLSKMVHQTIDKFSANGKSSIQKVNQKDIDELSVKLIDTCLRHEASFNKMVEPKLKNWELERVALLDIIMLHMALAEFLYFPNVPVKVTINEYIDLCKSFSTPKSKDFINGILDNIMRDLKAEKLIKKSGRGLNES